MWGHADSTQGGFVGKRECENVFWFRAAVQVKKKKDVGVKA